MSIYTKTGDKLQTSTFTNERVYKNDIIIDINGSIDELQSHIMVAYNFIDDDDIKTILLSLCKELYTFNYAISSGKKLITENNILQLEKLIDQFQDRVPSLSDFVYPGLTKAASFIHVARTVCRRAERLLITFYLNNSIDDNNLKYINRLSDLLYIIALNVDEIKIIKTN